ncbi:hypothetical protein [Streptomyces graminofaciens]|uniref:hypothetical protein n=1 Tax=Streptomyces graminofaciens TaxID=68212 RepID=UPI002573CAD1|nr:hypothetical protein [Streptomyces graminofaciens]
MSNASAGRIAAQAAKGLLFSPGRPVGELRTIAEEVTKMDLDIEIIEDGQVLLHHPSL